MRLFALNCLLVASLAITGSSANTRDKRNLDLFRSKLFGRDCIHPPLAYVQPHPAYYTIPGENLIIPAEEIHGPFLQHIPAPPPPPPAPLPVAFDVRRPAGLHSFESFNSFAGVHAAPAPAPVIVEKAKPCLPPAPVVQTPIAVTTAPYFVEPLPIAKPLKPVLIPPKKFEPLAPITVVEHQVPIAITPKPFFIERPLAIPEPPKIQHIVESHVPISVTPRPIIFGTHFPQAIRQPAAPLVIPEPPRLPELPKLQPIAPLPIFVKHDTPIPSGFSYHQVNTDGSVTSYNGAEETGTFFGANKGVVSADSLPSVLRPLPVHLPPKPLISSAPCPPKFATPGPVFVKHETPIPSGFSYHQVNTDGSVTSYNGVEETGKFFGVNKGVVPAIGLPSVPYPLPVRVGSGVRVPVLNAIPDYKPPIWPSLSGFPPVPKGSVSVSVAPSGDSGFKYNQINHDGSGIVYDGPNSHLIAGIENFKPIANHAYGPVSVTARPEANHIPAQAPHHAYVTAMPVLQKNPAADGQGGFSYKQVNADGSVSTFEKTGNGVDVTNESPTIVPVATPFAANVPVQDFPLSPSFVEPRPMFELPQARPIALPEFIAGNGQVTVVTNENSDGSYQFSYSTPAPFSTGVEHRPTTFAKNPIVVGDGGFSYHQANTDGSNVEYRGAQNTVSVTVDGKKKHRGDI